MADLIEDAKRLAAHPPDDSDRSWMGTDCHFCGRVLSSSECQWPVEGHAPDCPWLAAPRIVAVLEAARQLVGTGMRHEGDMIDPDDLMAWKWNAVVEALSAQPSACPEIPSDVE